MIKRIFINGAKAVIPIVLTIAIIVWLGNLIERIFGTLLKWIIGPEYYFPGLGFIVGIVLVFFVGLILNAWFVRVFHQWAQKLLRKIPLVKTLYNAITDLMDFLETNKKHSGSRVVIVHFGKVRLLGLVTREEFEGLPEGIGQPSTLLVYIPLSYQIGGHALLVPSDQVTPIQMSVEEAMRFAITGGMASRKEEKKK